MEQSDLAAVLGVQDVLARYAHLVDTRDLDAWAALFTEDAVWTMGDAECRGREAIRQFMADRPANGTGCHNITNVTVTPDGPDRARATANWILSRRAEPGEPWQIAGIGTYDEVMVRRDGRWLIQEHRIVPR